MSNITIKPELKYTPNKAGLHNVFIRITKD